MDITLTVRGSGPLAGFEATVVDATFDESSDDGILLTLNQPYALGGKSHTTALILCTNGLFLTDVGAFDLLYVPREQLMLLQKLYDQLLGWEEL